jgi:hypothetical protein
MLYLPVLLFGIAAIGGVTLVSIKVRGKTIPLWLALVHGILAAAALVILIVNVISNPGNMLMIVSLILFLIAALGGFLLFSYQLRKKPLPNPVIGIHALVAVTGFIVLLISVSNVFGQ